MKYYSSKVYIFGKDNYLSINLVFLYKIYINDIKNNIFNFSASISE